MDVTIIVCVITTLSAIIAPVVTEIVRSRNETKIKRMELIYVRKQQAYQDFADAYGRYRDRPNTGAFEADIMGKARAAMILSGAKGQEAMSAFCASLNHGFAESDAAFETAVSVLSKELQSLRY